MFIFVYVLNELNMYMIDFHIKEKYAFSTCYNGTHVVIKIYV